jgi:cytochrome c-type biogenesis protein CcmF
MSILLPWLLTGKISMALVLGLFLAFWVIVATLQNNQFRITFKSPRMSMLLAHSGFAICALGIVLSSALSVQKDVRMQFNDNLKIGPYLVSFKRVDLYEGPNFSAYRGLVSVVKPNRSATLLPELRIYKTQNMAISKTAILARPTHDLYIALGEQLSPNAWSLRIYYKPFVRWIWLGGLMMMLGGFSAAFRKRINQVRGGT